MTVTLRTLSNSGATTKGSALSHSELDTNFLFAQSASGGTVAEAGTTTTIEAALAVLSALPLGLPKPTMVLLGDSITAQGNTDASGKYNNHGWQNWMRNALKGSHLLFG
jgi:hypothetical protein